MGTISATITTARVEVNIAAQSGIILWTTKGSDSSTIALPINNVTRNKWWSFIVFKILEATCFYYLSPVICCTCRVSLSNELRPTVIPEKKPPAHERTKVKSIIQIASKVFHQKAGWFQWRYPCYYESPGETDLLYFYSLCFRLIVCLPFDIFGSLCFFIILLLLTNMILIFLFIQAFPLDWLFTFFGLYREKYPKS